jgi:type IV secretory pathway VirB2 component (pilin)
MTRNKLTAAFMLVLLLAMIAPVVHAQSSSDLGQTILRYLGPRREGPFWDILFIYPIFFFALVTLFMQGDKEMLTTIIMAVVLLLTVLSKLAPLGIFDQIAGPRGDVLIWDYPKGLIVFIIHCGIFALPIIVAGMTRSKKSRGPAIITGVLGGIYLFAFWFVMQRPGSEIENQFDDSWLLNLL